MQFTANNTIDQVGIHYFSMMTTKVLGHICRLNTSTDVGIDAWIELVDGNRMATGTYVAAQIKSSENTDEKNSITHYIDEKHKEYWLNHSIPVVFVDVNIDKNCILIKDISQRNLVQTNTRWKITLTEDDELSKVGRDLFSRLARPHPSDPLRSKLRELQIVLNDYSYVPAMVADMADGLQVIGRTIMELTQLLDMANLDTARYGREIRSDIEIQIFRALNIKTEWSYYYTSD
ncbi:MULTISPECIES: DUF4365 domain-containing protein [Gluconobacter]|uniref:DUF4365 domain-containing protein n=1 Tax=Gluconobacter cerinus TaxID=38307 RepID=A0AAV5NJN8_9PROT|nr:MULTISPECIES: DUF4365 domain-containing protein [Gluconobacter]MBS1072751.1 DUF4365 domain-containing protein [Gluconobacter cerinus]GBQ94518.1 hypothetical protein AA0229_0027 [Gluconobacter cerinus NRIC 0229]GLQ64198.1 hypothetical protein GCM10007867_30450 [Gluconobacter cerinus]